MSFARLVSQNSLPVTSFPKLALRLLNLRILNFPHDSLGLWSLIAWRALRSRAIRMPVHSTPARDESNFHRRRALSGLFSLTRLFHLALTQFIRAAPLRPRAAMLHRAASVMQMQIPLALDCVVPTYGKIHVLRRWTQFAVDCNRMWLHTCCKSVSFVQSNACLEFPK